MAEQHAFGFDAFLRSEFQREAHAPDQVPPFDVIDARARKIDRPRRLMAAACIAFVLGIGATAFALNTDPSQQVDVREGDTHEHSSSVPSEDNAQSATSTTAANPLNLSGSEPPAATRNEVGSGPGTRVAPTPVLAPGVTQPGATPGSTPEATPGSTPTTDGPGPTVAPLPRPPFPDLPPVMAQATRIIYVLDDDGFTASAAKVDAGWVEIVFVDLRTSGRGAAWIRGTAAHTFTTNWYEGTNSISKRVLPAVEQLDVTVWDGTTQLPYTATLGVEIPHRTLSEPASNVTIRVPAAGVNYATDITPFREQRFNWWGPCAWNHCVWAKVPVGPVTIQFENLPSTDLWVEFDGVMVDPEAGTADYIVNAQVDADNLHTLRFVDLRPQGVTYDILLWVDA